MATFFEWLDEAGAALWTSRDEWVGWLEKDFPWIADHLERDFHVKDADAAYFKPSDEPTTWQTKGKLVRLNVAIHAMHLFVAHVQFRSLTHTVTVKLNYTERRIAEMAEVWLAGKLSKAVVGKVLNVLNIIGELWQAERAQKEAEAAIRRWSLKMQRELKEAYMGAGKQPHRRHKKRVWSRHKST